MQWMHVAALMSFLVATVGVFHGVAAMLAEWQGSRDEMVATFAVTGGCMAIGFAGMVSVLWKDAFVSAVSALRNLGSSSTSESNATHVVFASMRFVDGKPLPEAIHLQKTLQEHGVFLKIISLTAGADITQEVFEAIEQAEAFLVFGTEDYGEKTDNPA